MRHMFSFFNKYMIGVIAPFNFCSIYIRLVYFPHDSRLPVSTHFKYHLGNARGKSSIYRSFDQMGYSPRLASRAIPDYIVWPDLPK